MSETDKILLGVGAVVAIAALYFIHTTAQGVNSGFSDTGEGLGDGLSSGLANAGEGVGIGAAGFGIGGGLALLALVLL